MGLKSSALVMANSLVFIVGIVLAASPVALGQGVLSFDGVDDCVRVPYDPTFPTETFTISAWIKLPPPIRRSAIMARGEDDNSFNLSWQLYVNPGGTLQIMLEDAQENNSCYPLTCMGAEELSCTAGDMLVGDDQWHHVAGTRDAAATLKLYIDGLEVVSCVQTAIPSSNNFQVLSFGCTHGTIGPPPGGVEPPIWFFPGMIDEPAMWNVALSDAEIQAVFLGGVDPSSVGLVGFWSFDECDGQMVVDFSPAGNDGFLGVDDDPAGDDADPIRMVSASCNLCAGDADASGLVDFDDINSVLGNWLADYAPGSGPGDANGDGLVDFIDINEVLSNWLVVCP